MEKLSFLRMCRWQCTNFVIETSALNKFTSEKSIRTVAALENAVNFFITSERFVIYHFSRLALVGSETSHQLTTNLKILMSSVVNVDQDQE